MKTAFITHKDFLKHDMGAGHPESPSRIHAIQDQLIASGIFDFLHHYEAPKASKESLALVHTHKYIDTIFKLSPSSGLVHLDGDTAMNPYSLSAALHASGAVIKGVDLVMTGKVQNAFCSVRPPGHHAGRANAAGFCIFNHVAIGAQHAIAHHGLERVAIADFDVHHGNGTEEVFYNDPRVMLCSTFRHPYYPYQGAESSNAHIINVPLSAGSNGEIFRAAVTEYWLPALERFKPQLVLISAGFDAHKEDDMGGLALRETDYLWVTEALKNIAMRHCNNRIVSTLEGGYSLHALGRSVMTHIKSLNGLT